MRRTILASPLILSLIAFSTAAWTAPTMAAETQAPKSAAQPAVEQVIVVFKTHFAPASLILKPGE